MRISYEVNTPVGGMTKFVAFNIVIGTIYLISFVVETFGVIAAVTVSRSRISPSRLVCLIAMTQQHPGLIRLYAGLSLLAAVSVIGGAIFRVVVHFVYKVYTYILFVLSWLVLTYYRPERSD